MPQAAGIGRAGIDLKKQVDPHALQAGTNTSNTLCPRALLVGKLRGGGAGRGGETARSDGAVSLYFPVLDMLPYRARWRWRLRVKKQVPQSLFRAGMGGEARPGGGRQEGCGSLNAPPF